MEDNASGAESTALADNSGVESPATEGADFSNQEPNQNPVNEGQPEEQEGDEEQEKLTPFHKHPEFIKRNNEIKRLKQELEAYQKGGQPTSNQQQAITQPSNEPVIESIVSQLPERQFKPEYTSAAEFYKDVRKHMLADLTEVNTITSRAREQSETETKALLAGFQSELGEDYEGFIDFADDWYKSGDEDKVSTSMKSLYKMYIARLNVEKQQSPKAAKPVSKVSKSTLGVVADGAPTIKTVRNMDWSEVIAKSGIIKGR